MPFDASKLVVGLAEAKRRKMEAARRAVDQFGQHVIGDAQQLTPVKTGALKASGTAAAAKEDGDVISQEIGFNTDYAAAVHEKLESKHDQGEAKFLEKAMSGNAAKFGPSVAAAVAAVESAAGGAG